MKFDNQLRYAVQIIDTYQGEIQLHTWLKDFFRVHPQMGSSDRRIVSTMVYGHYRLGHAVKMYAKEKRIIAGLFLCQDQPLELLNYFNPELHKQVSLPLTEKIAYFQTTPDGAEFRPEDIFPWKDQLSPGIDHLAFCLSFLRQPDLFLRIRPGHETTVREKLTTATVEFIPPATIRLPNGFKVEDYFTPDREIVIQDYNSQRVAEFLRSGPPEATPQFFWDACAASGGKSILAHDLYPKMELFVSDIRDSILRNLRSRFKTADIKKYHAFLVDLARQTPPASAAGADLILVDAPCTGSGTWGRTPEDAWFFNPEKIRRYSEVQKSILGNIAPQLSPDAALVYCTCSVFKKENEEMSAFIRDTLGLKEQARENLKGHDMRADTLFAARYTR
jgi:16S rRNA (cytosine967-C5)-methyltransferase